MLPCAAVLFVMRSERLTAARLIVGYNSPSHLRLNSGAGGYIAALSKRCAVFRIRIGGPTSQAASSEDTFAGFTPNAWCLSIRKASD